MSKITFNENTEYNDLSIARPEPKGFAYQLARTGIIKNPSDAAVLLAVVAMVLIGVSIYLFAQSIPEPKTLGEDQLRPGESVPDYVR
ncbi:MAG: hypothetical protein ACJKTH_03645 [Patescibacteria group bacterium UBA2163]